MASPKHQSSCSAVTFQEELSVQVLDSNKPLVTSFSLVPLCVQDMDSSDPFLGNDAPKVQDMDASDPLVGTDIPQVQDMDSSKPLVGVIPILEPVLSPSPASGSSGKKHNLYVEEIRSMWNWRKMYTQLGTREQCIAFAIEKGLLPRERICGHHRKPMSISRGNGHVGSFRCRKFNCRTRNVSRASGTWFENIHLPIDVIFQLMFCFAENVPYVSAQKHTVSDDGEVVSLKTIADWYRHCQDTVILYEIKHEHELDKIGGEGKIVQINVSKFSKRKINEGKDIEGHWVIGMIEDGNNDLRLEVCPDNDTSAEVLVPLIKKHVQEGSVILTDQSTAYRCLPEHGYVHRYVNHSDPEYRFVAPGGTHTHRIDSFWRGLKKEFNNNQSKRDFKDWLVERQWRWKINKKFQDPFEELIKAVAYVYKIK